MPVLYRKYRPQMFADVVGQDHVTRVLRAAIARDRVAHAYLFSGPRGVGKTTIARLLAKAVNCDQRGSDQEVPCNACSRCTDITAGRCMDVVEIDAASHTGVDHVREQIIEHARLAPAQAREKVFIIDEVHMLSTSAFNALLKTLEEPPAHVRFILATTELHKVPETIRSRCQQFAFRRVDAETLIERLRTLAAAEGATIDADVLAQIVRASDGSVRDAESALGQLLAMGEGTIDRATAALVLPQSHLDLVRALLEAMVAGNAVGALESIATAERSGADAEQFVRDCTTEVRDTLHRSVRTPGGMPSTLHVALLRSLIDLVDSMTRSDRPFFSMEVAMLALLVSSPSTSIAPRVASETPQAARPPKSERANDRPPDPPPSPPSNSPSSDRIPAAASPQGDAHAAPVIDMRSVDTPMMSAPSQLLPSDMVAPEETDLLARIRMMWGNIVRHASESNFSISYLLEGGRPRAIEQGTLTLGFRYQLHAEKIAHPRLRDVLTETLAALTGQPLRVATVVVSEEEFHTLDAASRPVTGDAVADAALEVFGGKVIG